MILYWNKNTLFIGTPEKSHILAIVLVTRYTLDLNDLEISCCCGLSPPAVFRSGGFETSLDHIHSDLNNGSLH